MTGKVGAASYEITFDPSSPWRSVNNLNSSTIPAPDGSHPDGATTAILPRLILEIRSHLGPAYATDARAQ